MALPVTIISSPGIAGNQPPFKSSGGAYYAIVDGGGGGAGIDAYKATDPSDSFSVQDAANNPAVTPLILEVKQRGDLLHLAYTVTAVFTNFYAVFDMSDDTWGAIDEEIENPTDNPILGWISLDARSDGDVVAVYNGDHDRVMGGDKQRVDVNVRSGSPPTWSGPTSLDIGADFHYGNPNIVKRNATDDMHILWQQTANTDDPPTAWLRAEGRTIRPDDSLSTSVQSLVNVTIDELVGVPNIAHVNGVAAGLQPAANQATNNFISAEEDASDDVNTVTSSSAGQTADPAIDGEFGINTIVGDGDTAFHAMWSGGGTAGVDRDIYYATSTDGEIWTGEVEELDGVTCNFISANIYVRGADTVMAYVYDDGGVVKYNEKVLIAGAAPFLPFYPKRPNVLLRM